MEIRERGNVFYPSSGLKVGRAEFFFFGQGGAEYSFLVPGWRRGMILSTLGQEGSVFFLYLSSTFHPKIFTIAFFNILDRVFYVPTF